MVEFCKINLANSGLDFLLTLDELVESRVNATRFAFKQDLAKQQC